MKNGGTPSLDLSPAYSAESSSHSELPFGDEQIVRDWGQPGDYSQWIIPRGTESCQQPCVRAWGWILSQFNLEMTTALDNTMTAACDRPWVRGTTEVVLDPSPKLWVHKHGLNYYISGWFITQQEITDTNSCFLGICKSKGFSYEVTWWREIGKRKKIRMAESKEGRLDSWL